MIKVGDRLPNNVFRRIGNGGIEEITTESVFGGRRAVLFAVPGAYTPTCTMNHLPGFIASFDAMRSKGVDVVAVTSVNDPFVMKAWAEATGATDTLTFLADGTADFARAIGLELELSDIGLGLRSKRYAMIVEDMTVPLRSRRRCRTSRVRRLSWRRSDRTEGHLRARAETVMGLPLTPLLPRVDRSGYAPSNGSERST